MSFQPFRKSTSSKQNERIKLLLSRFEKFQAEQNPIENDALLAKGFTDRSLMSFNDELTFGRLSNLSDENVKFPVEPDGDKLGLWYTFDGITHLEDRALFGNIGEVVGNTNCGVLAEGVDEGIGASGTMCMQFDNGLQYVQYVKTDTSEQSELTGKTTGINFFLRFKTGNVQPFQTLFEKIDDTDIDYAYKVVLVGGNLIFAIRHNGTTYVSGTGNSIIQNDTWYDCWFIFDIDTPDAYMYVNNTNYDVDPTTAGFDIEGFSSGGFSTTFTEIPFSSFTTNGTALIHGNNSDLNSPFYGYIQDFRIWNNMIISSTQIDNMWTNKTSISDIEYEKVCHIGFSLINGRIRRTVQEAILVADSFIIQYLVSNPTLRQVNESISVDDSPTVAKNPIIPRVVQEEVSGGGTIDPISETILISRLGVKVKIGNILKSTQKTGLPFVVSHSQELDFTPKFVIFWGNFNTQYNSYVGDDRFFIGFSDGTNDVALACSAADNSSSAQSARGLYNSAINNVEHDNTSEVLAKCSFTTNGFNLTYTVNDINDPRIINYMALGGSALTNTKVGTFVQPSTTPGAHAVTGVGFQPDMLMFLPTSLTTINTKSTSAIMSFGAGKNDMQRMCISGSDQHGQSTTNTNTISEDDSALVLIDDTGNKIKEADITSMDSDGFTLNYYTASGVAGLCGYAALKGLGVFVGSFNTTSGTGLQSVTYSSGETGGDHSLNIGFKPSCIIFTGNGRSVSDTSNSEFRMGFGAAIDSLNRRSSTFHIEDDKGTSNAVNRSESNMCFQLIEASSNSSSSDRIFEMDLVSLDESGFTIRKNRNTIGVHTILYIALG